MNEGPTDGSVDGIEIRLTDDEMHAAELRALEIVDNQQPNLPRYVRGRNCEICGRGIPRWEFCVDAVTPRGVFTMCGCCDMPDDTEPPGNYQVGRSSGGEIICRGCGNQVWAPTPQLQHCPNCWPQIWRDYDDATVTLGQFIARLDERYGVDA